jgi:large subunit ribosomal protein L4e
MTMVGAVAPGTVGGRRAHAPKAERIWDKKINVKERRQAILSAIAASLNKEIVTERGHKIPENYPFAVSEEFENIQKTRDAVAALNKLGFEKELERASVKKIRAGHGKARGRPYKTKKSLLVIVSKNCKLKDALENVTGVDVARLDELNAQLLAPGTHAGRAVLFTESAVKDWNEKKLYV